MKKIFILLTVLFFTAGRVCAQELSFSDFHNNVSPENLEHFTKDLSGLLGSGNFTTGRILGWGGFQLSGRTALMPSPSKGNTALGNAEREGHKFYPWIQGEIGLPFRLDGYIRASSFDGLTVAGGGLKWGIIRPTEILYTFQPMVVVLAESGVHESFSLTHYSADFVLSFRLPYVVPYLGGGVDYMKLVVQTAADASLVGETVYATTPRGVLGVNIRLPYYMDLSLAAHYVNYGIGGEASFGVRF